MLARLFVALLAVLMSFLLACGLAFAQAERAASLKIAVASNFSQVAEELIDVFQQQSSIDARLSIGSTGKITSQIEFGLNIDVFLAADSERPAYLIKQGLVPSNESMTYAIGRLVLWSPRAGLELNQGSLEAANLKHLAIANPRLAPYGRAAQESINAFGISADVQKKLVYGENVSQALQFALSGSAELALIARSQFVALASGSAWLVPDDNHKTIKQQAVRLSSASSAILFMQFLESEGARTIIAKYGYELPHG